MTLVSDPAYVQEHYRCPFCLSPNGGTTGATPVPEDEVDSRRFTCAGCGWIGRVHDKVECGDIVKVQPLLVGAAVVIRNRLGQFLASVRSSTGAFAGSYQVPGGVVRLGETVKEAALREVQEETGLALKPEHLRFLGRWRAKHPKGDYIVVMYLCRWAEEKVPALHTEPDKQSPWVLLGQEVLLGKPLIPGMREALYAANDVPPPTDLAAMAPLRKFQGQGEPYTDDEIREMSNPKVQVPEKEHITRLVKVLQSMGYDYVDDSTPIEDRVLKVASLLQGFGEGQVRAFAQMNYPAEMVKAHQQQYAQVSVFMRDLYELVRAVSMRYRQSEEFLKTEAGIAMSKAGSLS